MSRIIVLRSLETRQNSRWLLGRHCWKVLKVYCLSVLAAVLILHQAERLVLPCAGTCCLEPASDASGPRGCAGERVHRTYLLCFPPVSSRLSNLSALISLEMNIAQPLRLHSLLSLCISCRLKGENLGVLTSADTHARTHIRARARAHTHTHTHTHTHIKREREREREPQMMDALEITPTVNKKRRRIYTGAAFFQR